MLVFGAGVAQDILLTDSCEIVSQLESLRNIVSGEQLQTNRSAIPAMERSSADNRYVNVYHAPRYYWEKCFPYLYPYGRGGPSDPFFRMDTLRNYHCHLLRRGGGRDGRRFQSCAVHVFVTYTYEMKRKIGSMSYAATRSDNTDTSNTLTSKAVVGTLVECLSNAEEDEPLDIDVLYERIKRKRNSAGSSCGQPAVNDAEVLSQVKHLMQRLVPYAKQAPGTTMHMNFERKNMLAMITAPTIIAHAKWRWFGTFNYGDMYESRFYENVMDEVDLPAEWEDRESIVAGYSKKTRQKLLRSHPALVARIYEEKMSCLWRHVLHGNDAPVGPIADFMRRVEVCSIFVAVYSLYSLICSVIHHILIFGYI